MSEFLRVKNPGTGKLGFVMGSLIGCDHGFHWGSGLISRLNGRIHFQGHSLLASFMSSQFIELRPLFTDESFATSVPCEPLKPKGLLHQTQQETWSLYAFFTQSQKCLHFYHILFTGSTLLGPAHTKGQRR